MLCIICAEWESLTHSTMSVTINSFTILENPYIFFAIVFVFDIKRCTKLTNDEIQKLLCLAESYMLYEC